MSGLQLFVRFKYLSNGVIIMINNIKTLSSLNEGSSGRVAELKINGSMRRRLQDIGLIEGTEVLCLQKSPSGDPVAYLIRGAVIALRGEDSSKIILESV